MSRIENSKQKSKLLRIKNKDKINKQRRLDYHKNIEEKRKHARDYFSKHREYFVKYYLNKKIKVISHYSHGTMKCAICGESRIYALVIDHIAGGGTKHKKEVGSIYSWLIKHNFPDGYQVLCQNHNREKELINNEYHGKHKTPEQQKKDDDLKWEVFSYYSKSEIPYCNVCKETNLDILELDHVNGDGFKQKRLGRRIGGHSLYAKLKKEGYPDIDKYQILCSSCNYVKRTENKECRKTKEKDRSCFSDKNDNTIKYINISLV